MGLLFFADGFQVGRQFAQLRAGGIQLQLDPLVIGDVPDNAIPDLPTFLLAAYRRTHIGPAHFAITGEDAPLPAPVAHAIECLLLTAPISRFVIGMDQTADAATGLQQQVGGIAHQPLTRLADISDVDRGTGILPFEAKHQARHVARHGLQAHLAFLQRGAGAASLGDVGEKHNKVFLAAEAQEAEGHRCREAAAIGALPLALMHLMVFNTTAPLAPAL